MAGPYPLLFTDECIDGPERTNDSHLFEHAAARGRVFVTTDQDHLATADEWARSGPPFRMIFWEQEKTQRILVSAVVEAFEDIATKPGAFAYPIEYLKL